MKSDGVLFGISRDFIRAQFSKGAYFLASVFFLPFLIDFI